MGRKSSPPPPPQLPPPPKEKPWQDFIDEVTGTQTIQITKSDGKKAIKRMSLPRSESEEQLYKMGEELMLGALNNLQTLYQTDPAAIVNFQPFVEAFANINDERIAELQKVAQLSAKRKDIDASEYTQLSGEIAQERIEDLNAITNLGNIQEQIQNMRKINNEILDYHAGLANQRLENSLIQRGHYDSTVGDAARAEFGRQQALARGQNEVMMQNQAEQMMDNRLNRNQQVFNLNEQGRMGRLQAGQDALNQQIIERQQQDQAFDRAQAQYRLNEEARNAEHANISTKYDLAQKQKADLEARRQSLINANALQLQAGSNLTGRDLARNLQSKTTQNAMNNWTMGNTMQMNNYNANINRMNQNYQNQMKHYNAQGPSFGESMIQLGTTAVGAGIGAFGGYFGANMGASLGSKLGESLTSKKGTQGA